MSILIIKVVKITSFKLACVFLTLLFFYDIFWVFYSELIFNKSVMVTVATKIDLPMKLEFP